MKNVNLHRIIITITLKTMICISLSCVSKINNLEMKNKKQGSLFTIFSFLALPIYSQSVVPYDHPNSNFNSNSNSNFIIKYNPHELEISKSICSNLQNELINFTYKLDECIEKNNKLNCFEEFFIKNVNQIVTFTNAEHVSTQHSFFCGILISQCVDVVETLYDIYYQNNQKPQNIFCKQDFFDKKKEKNYNNILEFYFTNYNKNNAEKRDELIKSVIKYIENTDSLSENILYEMLDYPKYHEFLIYHLKNKSVDYNKSKKVCKKLLDTGDEDTKYLHIKKLSSEWSLENILNFLIENPSSKLFDTFKEDIKSKKIERSIFDKIINRIKRQERLYKIKYKEANNDLKLQNQAKDKIIFYKNLFEKLNEKNNIDKWIANDFELREKITQYEDEDVELRKKITSYEDMVQKIFSFVVLPIILIFITCKCC